MAQAHSTLGRNHKEMLIHFASLIWSKKKGKVLVGCWGIGILYALYAAIQKRKDAAKRRRYLQQQNQQRQQESRSKYEKRVPFLQQLAPLLRISFPKAFCSTTLHLIGYTILLCARIMLTIKIAQVTGGLGKTVGARSFNKMFELQAVFGLWCIPAAIVNSLLHFENSNLALAVRQKLVYCAHKLYLGDLVYYRTGNLGKTKIDDVDQIVTQDIKKFSSQLSEVYGNLLKPILEVFFLSRTLAKLMGGKQLAGFFVFFLIAGQFLKFIMPPFSMLTAETQRREGEFRSHHNRVITHAEEIAFYGGGDRERTIVNASFERVNRVIEKTYFKRMIINILDQYLVKYGAAMVAYSMMMPAVYLGLNGLKGKSAPEIMEYYILSTSLFVALGTACKHLVLSYKRIQDLAGLTTRVYELFEMLRKRAGGFEGKEDVEWMKTLANNSQEKRGGPPTVQIGDHIEFKDVDLFSPTGALLVRGLNFSVQQKSNVLVSGPNGSGKSSLFRVLGGLWPLCSGTMTKPAQDRLFYIPQQPYLAPGSLRDQITYPLSLTDSSQDKHLDHLMQLVSLEYLVDREGGWGSVREWADVLSGGEKQRVAMARLFFHKPAFGILDECTSAVSIDVEGKIYETCKELGITIFTVSHRPQLRHHHDYQLRFDGEGGWEWSAISN